MQTISEYAASGESEEWTVPEGYRIVTLANGEEWLVRDEQ